MNEQLRLLIELQRLDTAILSARMTIDAIPSKISSHEGPLKAAESAYEKAKQSHAALEKKKREKEHGIEELNERVKKLRQRTSEVKTNKEYQAHLKEIEAVEKEIRMVEDDILSIMESLDESSKLIKEEGARLAGERAKIDALKRDLEMEISKNEEGLKKLKDERKRLIGKIEDDIYAQYMGLMKLHRGLAIVEARNEICQGCNLHIPPQMFVELKKNEEIVNCPQCRRILYYVPPEGESNDAPQPAATGGQKAAAVNGPEQGKH